MFLKKWDDSVHNSAEQLTRQNRADLEAMHIVNIDMSTMSGRVRSRDGATVYDVSTEACSCPDFRKRGLPCKHMYYLDTVLERELVPSSRSRSVALVLAIFFGWAGVHRFYVGKVGSGLLWFFTVGLFCFGWWADIIKIAGGSFKDKGGRKLRRVQR